MVMVSGGPGPERETRDALIARALAAEAQSQVESAASLFQQVVQRERTCAPALLGLARLRVGQQRFGDALRLARRAVAAAPTDAAAHDLLGTVLQALGRWRDAIAAHRRAQALAPDAPASRVHLARALAQSGDVEAAIAEYDRALAAGGDAAVVSELAGLLLTAGRAEAARSVLEAALAVAPDAATLQADLGVVLARLGQPGAAIERLRTAIRLDPALAAAHNNLGILLCGQEDRAGAEAAFRTAIAVRPDYPEALNNLASLLQRAGRHAEAIGLAARAVALRPDFPEALSTLGVCRIALGQPAAALASLERAVALAPGLVEARNNLGNLYKTLEREAAALAQYEAVLALDPAHAAAWNNASAVQRLLGRLEAARRSAARAVALSPDEPGYYYSLAVSGRLAADDPAVAAMERLVAEPAGAASVHLRFALAKAYADQGRVDAAFDQLLHGNRLKRAGIDYDETAALAELARIGAHFTAERLARHRGLGPPSRRPLFIIGMPRSGSTLIEQVLASHPAVDAAGENPLLPTLVGRLGQFPDAAAEPATLAALGRDYLSGLAQRGGKAARVTDKMLANFRLAGLIAMALPGARIIHVRRDPLDCCLSAFATLFGSDVPYAYDLGELGRYHAAYRRLMAHWRAVLDPAQLLEVDYEAVVGDLEGETRRMLDHCGLPWDASCLAFHRSERVVRTASTAQVRQPLNRDGIGRWRLAPERLAPLLAGLAGDAP